ncbi:MAG TPA: DUF5615 family PIN-like protein [Planctomycetaceae bacterium]|nr:DUF5615 family PIN-like protein [Planctomycetaceae bacterium]
MARLYANENFPFPVVEELRRLGHDVLTIQNTGKSGQGIPDQDVLEFATTDDRAVLTINRRHFIALHSRDSSHSGIIACTLDSDFLGQAARIDTTIAGSGDIRGKLLRVNRPPR